MRQIKFRWLDAHGVNYLKIYLPDNAQMKLYTDKYGVEVYENELVFDGEKQFGTEITFDDDPNAISLDCIELTRTVHKKSDWCGLAFVEHEPLYLSESILIDRQANDLNDKIARDAKLGFSESVFDLLPELSELRDVEELTTCGR